MSDSELEELQESIIPAARLTESTIRPVMIDVPGFLCGRCGSIELAVEVVVTPAGQLLVKLSCRRCGNVRQQILEVHHGDSRN